MKFTKMQGLGNDFILLEAEEFLKTGLSCSELAKKLCDRNFGIGADGLIIVNPPEIKSDCHTSWRMSSSLTEPAKPDSSGYSLPLRWRIFNSDGSEPQMCGNGIRCFAKYVYNKGIIDKKVFSVSTLAGTIIPEILDNGTVKVDMGSPVLEPSKIPAAVKNADKIIAYPLETDRGNINITAVSMGNPHCIVFTDKNTEELAKTLGPKLEIHPIFPEKTNVEIVKVISRNKIKVNVWERGCGITLACGTGACASVAASVLNDFTENNVEVNLPGGNLYVEWEKSTNKLFLTGKAEFVFEGEYFL